MNKIIKATEGNVFQRIEDDVVFGEEIHLGIDYSTGNARDDKKEYYIEILKPIEEEINIIE